MCVEIHGENTLRKLMISDIDAAQSTYKKMTDCVTQSGFNSRIWQPKGLFEKFPAFFSSKRSPRKVLFFVRLSPGLTSSVYNDGLDFLPLDHLSNIKKATHSPPVAIKEKSEAFGMKNYFL